MCSLFSDETKTEQTNSTDIPGYFSNLMTSLAAKTQSATDAPFKNFTGERVAGLTGNENQGIAKASADAGMYNPLLGDAQHTAQNMMHQTGPSATDLSQFMNPYTDYVLNNSLARLNEQAQANNVNIGSSAAMSNAFGGLRHGVLEGANLAELLKSSGELSNKTYSDAFDKGMSNWMGVQNLKRGAVQDATNIASTGTQTNNTDLANLMSTGYTGRSVDQMGKDFKFSEFDKERNDPLAKVAAMSDLVSHFPTQLFTTHGTATTTSTPSVLSGVIGLASAAGSLMGGPKSAKGGLIKKYAAGGSVLDQFARYDDSATFGLPDVNPMYKGPNKPVVKDPTFWETVGSSLKTLGDAGDGASFDKYKAMNSAAAEDAAKRLAASMSGYNNRPAMDPNEHIDIAKYLGGGYAKGGSIPLPRQKPSPTDMADPKIGNARLIDDLATYMPPEDGGAPYQELDNLPYFQGMVNYMSKLNDIKPFNKKEIEYRDWMINMRDTAKEYRRREKLGLPLDEHAYPGSFIPWAQRGFEGVDIEKGRKYDKGGKVTQYSKDERDALTRLIEQQVYRDHQVPQNDFQQRPPLRGTYDETSPPDWSQMIPKDMSVLDHMFGNRGVPGMRAAKGQTLLDLLSQDPWGKPKFAKGGQIPKFSGEKGSAVLPNFTETSEGDPLRDIEGNPTFSQSINPENYDLGIDQLEAAHTRKVGDKWEKMDSFLSLNDHTQAFSLYQFLPETWNTDIKKISKEDQKRLGIRPITKTELMRYQQGDKELYDVFPSKEAQRFVYHKVEAPKIAGQLKAAGLPVTPENVYYGHHFGPGAVRTLIPAIELGLGKPGTTLYDALKTAKLANKFTAEDIKANNLNRPLVDYVTNVKKAFNNPGLSPTTSKLNAENVQSGEPSKPGDYIATTSYPGMQPKDYNTYEIRDALSRAKPYDASWDRWRSDVERAQRDDTDPRYARNKSLPTGEVDNRTSLPGTILDRPPYHWHEGMPPATVEDLFAPVPKRLRTNNQDINYSGGEDLTLSQRADILTRKSRPEIPVSPETAQRMGKESNRTEQKLPGELDHFLNMFSPGFAKGGAIRRYAGRGESVILPIDRSSAILPIDQEKAAELRDRARREWELKGILDQLAPGPGYEEPPAKTYSTPRPNMIDERDPLGKLATPLTGKDRYMAAVDANRKAMGLKPYETVAAKTWADAAGSAKDYAEGAHENGSNIVSRPWETKSRAGRFTEGSARMLGATIPLINEGVGQAVRGGMNAMSWLFDPLDDKAVPQGRKDLTANPTPLASPLDNYQYDAGDPFGMSNVLKTGDKLVNPDILTAGVEDDGNQSAVGATHVQDQINGGKIDPNSLTWYDNYIREAKAKMDAADAEKEPPFLGMFSNVNKDLLRFGLTMLASPGKNFAEDLGMSGLSVLDKDQADLLQKQDRAAARFKEALNAKYIKAQTDMMDPNIKLRIQQNDIAGKMALESLKAQYKLAEGNQKLRNDIRAKAMELIQQNYNAKGSEGFPSDEWQQQFKDFGLPELPPTSDMIESTD